MGVASGDFLGPLRRSNTFSPIIALGGGGLRFLLHSTVKQLRSSLSQFGAAPQDLSERTVLRLVMSRGIPRAFWVATGLLVEGLAAFSAAGEQAGVTSSASQGGQAPTLGSLELLYAWILVACVGAGLAAWGVSPFLPRNSRPKAGTGVKAGPESSLLRAGFFLTASACVLGFGLYAMGALIELPVFCFSHGPGPCLLSGSTLAVPHELESAGATLAVVGGGGFALLRYGPKLHNRESAP